ncbi:MAG: BMC domain-containing protein [Vicinamibacteria bacterium]|nr:BMC domain-containing protein [Vicinamibacteria bacterium]
MADLSSVGLVEVTSIAFGYLAEDAMLKTASVELLLARTICAGKYLVVVGGDVASVEAAVEAGANAAEGSLIEKRVIPHVHPSVFPAISMAVDLSPDQTKALGVIETFSASSIIEVADAAAKTAAVTLIRIHLAMAIGGKGLVLLTGDVASVEAAVIAGAAMAGEEGILAGQAVIAAPSKDLFREYI